VADLHFVLGGAASGKSRYAVARAAVLGRGLVTFIATAKAGDPELDLRIAAHRRERPPGWATVEADEDLAMTVSNCEREHVLLIDSLTLWVAARPTGAGHAEDAWTAVEEVIAHRLPAVVLVSDEVGLGVVPDTPVGRRFRDELGRVNQRVAHGATTAVLVVAGVPLPIAPARP